MPLRIRIKMIESIHYYVWMIESIYCYTVRKLLTPKEPIGLWFMVWKSMKNSHEIGAKPSLAGGRNQLEPN